jgi:hypothetical protein
MNTNLDDNLSRRKIAINLLKLGPISLSEFHSVMGVGWPYTECLILLTELSNDGIVYQPTRSIYALRSPIAAASKDSSTQSDQIAGKQPIELTDTDDQAPRNGFKTPKEIADLKRDWLADGTWDLEETEEFEAHKAELLEFRLDHENTARERKELDERRALEKLNLDARALELSPIALQRIIRLECQLSALQLEIDTLQEQQLRASPKKWHEVIHRI